jgi:hypothetical protein
VKDGLGAAPAPAWPFRGARLEGGASTVWGYAGGGANPLPALAQQIAGWRASAPARQLRGGSAQWVDRETPISRGLSLEVDESAVECPIDKEYEASDPE